MAIFAIYLELPGFFNTWMSRWPPFFPLESWSFYHWTMNKWEEGYSPPETNGWYTWKSPFQTLYFWVPMFISRAAQKSPGGVSSAKNHPVSDLGSVRYRPSPIHKASWEVSAPPVEDSVPRSPRCPLTRSSPGPGRDVFSGMSFSIHFWAWDQLTYLPTKTNGWGLEP